MKYLFLFGSFLFSSVIFAQNRQIIFETGNWASVLQKAKKENKLIFVDAYTTWCGPCKHMAKHTFTRDSVADFYNSKFVNYKMDMEKGEGIEFAKKYDVNCYPNLLIIDSDGNIVHRGAGYMEQKGFIAFGEKSLSTDQNFNSLKKSFETNGLNESNVLNYIQLLSGSCLDPSEKVNAYIKTVKDEDLMNRANWIVLRDFVHEFKSREITYFLKNRSLYEEKYGKDSVQQKVSALGQSYFADHTKPAAFDKAGYDKAKQEFLKMNWPNAEKIIFDSDLRVYKKYDRVKYYELASKDYLKYYNNNASELNSMAWHFYEKVNDASQLKAAKQMAARAVELENHYAYHDTYAAVLYKTGEYSEAEKAATKAIEKAKLDKMSPDEYKETSELLAKIQAKLKTK